MEKILHAKLEFNLRETLGIVMKGFHELIIDVINKMRRMTIETMMINALNSLVTKEEDDEIGQMFALRCDSMGSSDKIKEHEVIFFRDQQGERGH